MIVPGSNTCANVTPVVAINLWRWAGTAASAENRCRKFEPRILTLMWR